MIWIASQSERVGDSMRKKKIIGKIFIHTGLIITSLLFLLPLLWILRTSLISKVEAYQIPPNWKASFTLENYANVLNGNSYLQYFFNSFGISIITTVIAVIFGAMASYWIARFAVKGNAIRISILLIQMIPPVVLIIPFSMIISQMKLSDTWISLIITYLSFTLPYVMWMLVGFFEGVPKDLDEAAKIDGCNSLQTYFQIVLPLAMPGIMATAVYSFIVSWNEFMYALNLTGLSARTVPVAIANMDTSQGVQIAELCASVLIGIIPIIILSLFIKKYLVSGLTFGSVK